uniref:Uncharacterized protein n=1 Tax=Anopheles farauti TaxID=69004 RepID=A0A182QL48_9DIPT
MCTCQKSIRFCLHLSAKNVETTQFGNVLLNLKIIILALIMENTSLEYSSLIKEQRQLRKAETILKSMIDKINHELNQLVVEELQIKSRDVQLSVAGSTPKVEKSVPAVDIATCSTAEINRQVLDLDVHGSGLLKSIEESEDEL